MAILYVCSRDRAKKNTTVQVSDIQELASTPEKILGHLKNVNKQCCELNETIDKIKEYNELSSCIVSNNEKKETIVDLKDIT